MASISFLAGPVTHVDRVSSTYGSVRDGHGSIRTAHRLMFRLDGKAAVYDGVADLSVGDPATAAGIVKNGPFQALAVRNDATGIVFGRSGLPEMIIGGIIGLISLIAVQGHFVLGLPIAALAAWVIKRGLLVRNARNALLSPDAVPAHPY